MHMWWVFNRLTWICPPFRLWISRCLGMKLVDSRRKHVKILRTGMDMDKFAVLY